MAPDIQNTTIAALCDVYNGEIDSKSIQRGENMDMFKIKVARIEMISPNEREEDVRLTFQFEGRQTMFTLPIFLNSREFDDTEIVKVARFDAFPFVVSSILKSTCSYADVSPTVTDNSALQLMTPVERLLELVSVGSSGWKATKTASLRLGDRADGLGKRLQFQVGCNLRLPERRETARDARLLADHVPFAVAVQFCSQRKNQVVRRLNSISPVRR